jgi:uncharacterized protein YfeS
MAALKTTAALKETATIQIEGALHALLKRKAKIEGRVLKAMVEEKLRELVRPEQLQLTEEMETR